MSRFRSFDLGPDTKAHDGSSLRVRGRSPTRQHRPTTAGVMPRSTYKSEPNIRSERPMSASEAAQFRLSSRSTEHNKPAWGGSSKSSVSSRPSSVASSSRRSSLASSSGRKTTTQKFKKRDDFVDETLFGVNRNSAEEQHKALHNLLNTEPFCRKPDPVVAGPPKRTRARPSTRPDLNAMVNLPRAPKASTGQRFQKTTTLQGGYEPERHAKPGPPRADHSNLLQHKPHRAHRNPPTEQKTTVHSPFIHENPTVSQPAPKYRPTNSLWGNYPDV
eukprot:m.279070 g.279070  ORF g.279070 m.279070 type:complete len:274 (-) comp139300_c0_seq1:110-931(-)